MSNPAVIKLTSGWRLTLTFLAGSAWRADLEDPRGVVIDVSVGRVSADDAVDATVSHLRGRKLLAEADDLRRRWARR